VPALKSLKTQQHITSLSAMQIYFGLAVWGIVAFAIYKGINLILVRRQLAGE
jgi:hypothetical protein